MLPPEPAHTCYTCCCRLPSSSPHCVPRHSDWQSARPQPGSHLHRQAQPVRSLQQQPLRVVQQPLALRLSPRLRAGAGGRQAWLGDQAAGLGCLETMAAARCKAHSKYTLGRAAVGCLRMPWPPRCSSTGRPPDCRLSHGLSHACASSHLHEGALPLCVWHKLQPLVRPRYPQQVVALAAHDVEPGQRWREQAADNRSAVWKPLQHPPLDGLTMSWREDASMRPAD